MLESSGRDRSKYTVAVAQAIHAVIKTNDALTLRFLHRRSTHHEDAALWFKELVQKGKVPAKYARWRDLVLRASAEKSEYDYHGAEVGRQGAER